MDVIVGLPFNKIDFVIDSFPVWRQRLRIFSIEGINNWHQPVWSMLCRILVHLLLERLLNVNQASNKNLYMFIASLQGPECCCIYFPNWFRCNGLSLDDHLERLPNANFAFSRSNASVMSFHPAFSKDDIINLSGNNICNNYYFYTVDIDFKCCYALNYRLLLYDCNLFEGSWFDW